MPATFLASIAVTLALAFAPPTDAARRVPRVTEADAIALIDDSTSPLVLTFRVPGCHFCHAAWKELIAIAAERPAVRYAEVDLSDAPRIAERFALESAPQQLVFVRGRLVRRTAGLLSPEELDLSLARSTIPERP
jgi:thioredoxin-like negative regulator of GroEL